MIKLEVAQSLYSDAVKLCEAEGRNEAWLYERKLIEVIIEECGIALRTHLRDQISRGQAYDLIKEQFGIENE
jgi:hypothetical protein